MAHEIFISYAAEDKSVADAVCQAIEAEGLKCWYAPRDVGYGRDFEESIVDAIGVSRLLILILTAHSNDSAHVKREIQNACLEEVGVPVLPFRIEDIPLNKALRYYIGSVHWLDAVTPPLETHLQRLVEHVRARLSRPAKPEETEIEKKRAQDDLEEEQAKRTDDRGHDKGAGLLAVPRPQVSNYLAPAIVASVFCCLPVGVTSLVFAMQATSKAAAGEIDKAVAKARLARNFLITAIALGLAAYVILIFVMVVSPYLSRNPTSSKPNTNGPATNINRSPTNTAGPATNINRSTTNNVAPPTTGFPLSGLQIDIFYVNSNQILAQRLYDKLRDNGAQVTLYDRTIGGQGIFGAETALYYYGEESDNAKKIAAFLSGITFVKVGSTSSGAKHSDGIQFYLWVGKG